MRAIQMSEFGGPEVLRETELPQPEAGDGEVLIEVRHAGLNFADTHQRTDSYVAKAELPLIPGSEVAGVRADTGERVIALTGRGGYAQFAIAPEAQTWPIPDGLDDGTALALLLQGLTAWHMYTTCAHVREGESIVVHAAAGGVGSLAVQLGGHFGAGRVIATASSEDKRAAAAELGADATTDSDPEGLRDRLIECNGGDEVDVVIEMAGGESFEQSLRALAPFGRVIVCGIATREKNMISTGHLLRHSRSVIGFWLFHCLGRPEMVDGPLAELFDLAARRQLRALVGATYPLAEAPRAHTDLAARRTTGKLLLDPWA
ncbi:MAG TPA: NADPH:quinone oxidoreductase family protein [Solirubrobacteraceae bacterium]|nr:NADPH:quinone oxidoreductase family protein [Solirubrobacteraceae bacterium]